MQGGILGEEVKILEHQAKMKPFLANVLFRLRGGVRRGKNDVALYGNRAVVRTLQEIQAAEQGCLAGTGRADNRQRLSLFQGEADVVEDLGVPEVLFNMLNL